MLSQGFRHFLRDLQAAFKLLARFGQGLGADRRCALKLDRVADRLLEMARRIHALRERMLTSNLGAPMDADFALRESLSGLKEDIRVIRCQLAVLDGPGLSARLQRAFARLRKVAEETYASADRLQWEIGEHEQRFSTR
jgi:hypothetical protein